MPDKFRISWWAFCGTMSFRCPTCSANSEITWQKNNIFYNHTLTKWDLCNTPSDEYPACLRVNMGNLQPLIEREIEILNSYWLNCDGQTELKVKNVKVKKVKIIKWQNTDTSPFLYYDSDGIIIILFPFNRKQITMTHLLFPLNGVVYEIRSWLICRIIIVIKVRQVLAWEVYE